MSKVFDKLLRNYADQLALLAEETFGQIPEVDEDTLTRPDGLGMANEDAPASRDNLKTDLDESRFVPLDEASFAVLDKLETLTGSPDE